MQFNEEIKWKTLLKTYYLLYSLFLLLKLLISIFYLYTGVKSNTKGMGQEEYAKRLRCLSTLKNDSGKMICSKVIQSRFKKHLGEIQMVTFNKYALCQLNDKVYYFENGLVSLPHGHPALKDVIKQRQNKSVEELCSDEVERESLKLEDSIILKLKTLRYYSAIIDHILPSGISVRNKLLRD